MPVVQREFPDRGHGTRAPIVGLESEIKGFAIDEFSSRWQETDSRGWRIACSDGNDSLAVDERHLNNLKIFIFIIVLHNAQAIYLDIFVSEVCCHFYSILKRPWQCVVCDALPLPFEIRFGRLLRLLSTPTVTQCDIWDRSALQAPIV
jgi:hypothetical protein